MNHVPKAALIGCFSVCMSHHRFTHLVTLTMQLGQALVNHMNPAKGKPSGCDLMVPQQAEPLMKLH